MTDAPDQCLAEIAEVRILTHTVKEICLKPIHPSPLRFIAGQYISIEVTEQKDGHSRSNNRAYSIASAPEDRKSVV